MAIRLAGNLKPLHQLQGAVLTSSGCGFDVGELIAVASLSATAAVCTRNLSTMLFNNAGARRSSLRSRWRVYIGTKNEQQSVPDSGTYIRSPIVIG